MSIHNFHEQQAIAAARVKLIAVDTCLTALEGVFAQDAEVSSHLSKIRKWTMRCWSSVGAGSARLTTAMMRRADKESAIMDSVRHEVIGPCTTVPAWASWLICLDALVYDVRVQWRGGKASCWRFLNQDWDTLARQFLAGCEDQGAAEENGTAMYLRIVEGAKWA